MTWLPTIPPEDATGDLRDLYQPFVERFGVVPNIVQALSLSPRWARLADDFRRSISPKQHELGDRREHLIAIVTADHLRCHY